MEPTEPTAPVSAAAGPPRPLPVRAARSAAPYFALALLIIGLDQLSKYLTHTQMQPGLAGEIPVFGQWFKLHYILNPGMAFGVELPAPYGKVLLTLFRLLAVGGIAYYIARLARQRASAGYMACMALILGGAVGNLIDSIFYGILYHNAPFGVPTPWFHGQVIDMLYADIYEGFLPQSWPLVGGKYLSLWPIFNLADSSIFAGVAAILLFQKRFFKEDEAEAQPAPGTVTDWVRISTVTADDDDSSATPRVVLLSALPHHAPSEGLALPPPKMPLLSVENLSIDFRSHRGDVRAVAGVSFAVGRGETVAIVGESGSGKSVTAMALLGLLPMPPGQLVSGTARFESEKLGDVDLLALSERQLRQVRGNDIGMIFQEPMTSLNPVLTCGYQVAEALLLHTALSKSEAKARTIELFAQAQLPRPAAIFDSYPHQVSGGQKQRVMISMAMACQPALLIADEPTTALDVTVQARMLRLIDDLRRQHGTAVLFITHDLGVVAEIADRILVMYRGAVVEQGPVLEIFGQPRHPYTRGLLACRPHLSAGQRRLPVVADFMVEDVGGALLPVAAERNATAAPGRVGAGEVAVASGIPAASAAPGTGAKQLRQISEQSNRFPVEHFTDERGTAGGELGDGAGVSGGAGAAADASVVPVPLLQVENLAVHFPVKGGFFRRTTETVRAVDDVSFALYPGETIGLVGESGCGKTTLGRALLRLTEPTAGRILFEGDDLAALAPGDLRRKRRELQLVFQDPYAALNPMLTVGEAIWEPMRVHAVGGTRPQQKARVLELLRIVGLRDDHFERYPHEFSGGQRQRICIARALALQPKLIVCDESVSALDVSVQAQVLNLLNDLKRDFGITYLFITHDLSVARFMSDRLLVMHQGRVVESGPAADVYARPQHPYTQSLLAAIPKDGLADIAAAVAGRRV